MKLAIEFYRPDRTGSVVARLLSEVSYQTRPIRADFGLEVARRWPAVAPGRYPVDVGATPEGRIRLEIAAAGRRMGGLYPTAALRVDELLPRLLARDPALEGSTLHCRCAGVIDEAAVGSTRRFHLARSGSPASLEIIVPAFATLEAPVNLADLTGVDVGDAGPGEPPVIVSASLLERLALEESARASEPFVEHAYYLVGRALRNGHGGDVLVIVDEAIAAEHTIATATMVVMTEASELAARAALARYAEVHGSDRRIVGWLHSHGPIGPANLPGVGDLRFFSPPDVRVHRLQFPPEAVALVMDAVAAAAAPREIGRVFGCFAMRGGLVKRRGFLLGGNRLEGATT